MNNDLLEQREQRKLAYFAIARKRLNLFERS